MSAEVMARLLGTGGKEVGKGTDGGMFVLQDPLQDDKQPSLSWARVEGVGWEEPAGIGKEEGR
jgi:hypothetical protein